MEKAGTEKALLEGGGGLKNNLGDIYFFSLPISVYLCSCCSNLSLLEATCNTGPLIFKTVLFKCAIINNKDTT